MSGQNVSLFIGICFPFIKLGHASALYLKNRRKEIKSQYNWIVCKIPHEIALQDDFLSKLIRKMERQVKNTRKSPHMTIEITWGKQDQSEVISNVPITDLSME